MTGSERPRLAVALWLLILALSGWQLAHTRIVADLGAFLPPSATPAQQLLLEQMRSGVASRILLVALGGADDERLADASRAHGGRSCARASLFASVQNGGDEGLRADREAFMNYRYVLSPAAGGERFSAPALRASLESALAELATQSAGPLRAAAAARSDRRAAAHLRAPAGGGAGEARRRLVHRRRQARAAGRGNRRRRLRRAGAGTGHRRRSTDARIRSSNVEVSGPGVFAAASRTQIERDAWLLSLVSGTLVLLLLLRIYRRPRHRRALLRAGGERRCWSAPRRSASLSATCTPSRSASAPR